jgi:hypothetical protein
MAVVFAADCVGAVDGHPPTATVKMSKNTPTRILEFEDENFTNGTLAPVVDIARVGLNFHSQQLKQ